MKLTEFCQAVALVLLATAVSECATSATSRSSSRRRVKSPGTARNVSLYNSEQLCSVVMRKPNDPPCSAENCILQVPATKANLNATDGARPGSNGFSVADAGLTDMIARMDDGIRIMDSQKGSGEQNVFVLGMTGAGKSTITLLLTAYSSLYACKRSASDLSYIIRDVKTKISTVDSLSKTKVPEIIPDPRLNTTFYDCPGFSDTNSTDELTNAYFIKHGLDSSKRTKFLLVAPLNAFQTSGDRHYFGSLLLHTVKTITNIEKYNESFALAVTFGIPTFSPAEIVDSVAGFLETFLNGELERKFGGQGEEVLNRTKALLDSLLAQDEDGTFVAIAVFRSPTSHGPLTGLVTVQEDRELLMRVLTDGTSYADADPQDFGYSVSDGGRLRAAELGILLDDILTEKLDQFWQEILHRYESELYHLADPIEQKANIDGTLGTFLAVRQLFNASHTGRNSAARTVGPKEFVVNLMSLMAPLGLHLPSNSILSSVLLQDNHVTFIETLVGKPLQLRWTNWLKGVEPTVKFLEVYTSWSDTLIQLEQNLGRYEIQNADYCVPEFRDQSSGSISVTAAKVQNFISTRSAPTEIYNTLVSALIPFVAENVVNFYQLHPIFEYFFTRCDSSFVKCTSEGATARFTGNFIFASKVRTASCISASTKHVTVIALDTFFLDAAIIAKSSTGNGTFSLVLIAGKLKSFGYKIDLTGRHGPAPSSPSAGKGQDGTDGTKGEAGGYYFGVFGEKQGEISVQSNGGKGGDGQHGGVGVSGRNGTVVRGQDFPERKLVGKCEARIKSTQSSYVITFYGDAVPEPGGKGGNGGAAGQGGQPGGGKSYLMNGTSSISGTLISGSCGNTGSPGKGEKGGVGGMSSNVTACYDQEVMIRCIIKDIGVSPARKAPDGDFGREGSFPSSYCSPDMNDFDPYPYTSEIISFKSAGRAELKSPTARRILPRFLMILEQNKDLNREFFPVKSLIADVVSLEGQLYSSLNVSRSHLPFFYESVLNRTAESMVTTKPSVIERALLREAASVAYGRLMALRKSKTGGGRSNLITDLEGYIDHANGILKSLVTLESKSNAARHIIATKERFTAFMRSKIKEVDDLIKKVIEPEISKIQAQLKNTMGMMIQQLLAGKVQGARFALYSQQFQDTRLVNQIFTSLKLGAQIVSFAGPWGAAAGAAISTAPSVAETFSSGDTGASSDVLAELQEKALSWCSETKKQILEEDKLQLVDLKAELENKFLVEKPVGGGNTWSIMKVSKRTMNAALNRVVGAAKGAELGLVVIRGRGDRVIESIAQQAESIKNEVRTELETVEKVLQTEVNNQVQTLENELETKAEETPVMGAQKILGVTKKMLAIARTASDLYKLFRQDDSKVSDLAKAEEVLQGIDGKINTVDTRMPQVLKQLQKITAEAFKYTRNQSSFGAALDPSGWYLQSTLDDIGTEIDSKILAGVPLNAQVKSGMRILKEAFQTLYKVCDRIQDYMADQRMVNFVSESLLSTVNAVPLQQDPELRTNFQKLRLVSQSNLVLNYWRNIENAFRMYAFPYADIYLTRVFSLLQGEHDLLLLPRNLTDLRTLVVEISRRTKDLRTKLVTFRTTAIPALHTNMQIGRFSLARPFYTWTTDEVKPILFDLLSGNVVNLMADVRQSPGSYDAIKFNGTHLHLIHENAAVNLALQSALVPFSLEMTHTGVNYYRFDGRHYRVYSEPLSLQVSYERGQDQDMNLNFVPVGHGPPLLSPYTLWTFRLYTDSPSVTFDRLRQYSGEEISLVLTGYATYVENSTGQSTARKVDRFYDAVEL